MLQGQGRPEGGGVQVVQGDEEAGGQKDLLQDAQKFTGLGLSIDLLQDVLLLLGQLVAADGDDAFRHMQAGILIFHG